jgi:hypothetical protein
MRRMDTFAETVTKTPPVPLPLAGECYQYASRRQDQERLVAPGSAPLGEAWLDPEGAAAINCITARSTTANAIDCNAALEDSRVARTGEACLAAIDFLFVGFNLIRSGY